MLTNNFNLSPNECFFSIGTMSGTSMDGIDVALIKTDGYFYIEEIGHISINYTKEFHQLLKVAEYLIYSHQGDLSKAFEMDFTTIFEEYFLKVMKTSKDKALEALQAATLYLHKEINTSINLWQIIDHSTFLHEMAILKLIKITGYNSINIIGYHGQTLFHHPKKKITIQIGDSQELANRLNTMIISDFRSTDVALGGQGAPLAPLYHLALAVRDQRLPLAVVNCGGIANISLIVSSDYKDLKGYDTGPGNGLIDLFVKQRTGFQEHMDYNGKYALKGKVNAEILEKLYANSVMVNGKNFFDLAPPKSLDINNLKLIPELEELSLEDGCATLAAFTADSIIKNLNIFTNKLPRYWVLAGGGWYNPVIKRELEQRIKAKLHIDAEHKIYLAEEIGWNNKAIEAQIFAYLAVRAFQGMPISVSETTGVSKPITFSKLTVSDENYALIQKKWNQHETIKHYSMVYKSLKNLLLQEKTLELSSDHVSLLIIANNIAQLYKYLNKHDKAIEYYKKSHIHQQTMKTSNVNMTYNLIQIGLMNQQLAKNISTLMYYEKALNILKGKKHPQISMVLIKIAEVYNTLKLDQLAIHYYEDAIKSYIKIYGNNNRYIADILDKIADIHQMNNECQLAMQYYQRSLSMFQYIYNKHQNDDISKIANILSKIEMVHENLKKEKHGSESLFTENNYKQNIKITRFYRKYSL